MDPRITKWSAAGQSLCSIREKGREKSLLATGTRLPGAAATMDAVARLSCRHSLREGNRYVRLWTKYRRARLDVVRACRS